MGTPGPSGILPNQQCHLEEQMEDHHQKKVEGVMPGGAAALQMDSPDICLKPEIFKRALRTSRSEHNSLDQLLLGAHPDVAPYVTGEGTLPDAVISDKGMIKMFLMPVKQDVDLKEENDIVCVHFASQRGRSELVERLLQPGLNDHNSNNDLGNSLHCVAIDGKRHYSQAHIIFPVWNPLARRSIYEKPGDSMTSVSRLHPELEYCVRMYAHRNCFSDDSDTITKMLNGAQELGVLSINAQDRNGNTILHGAARKGQIDLVKILLKCGAFISTLNYSSQTPYQLAPKSKAVHIKKLLDGHISSSFPKAQTLTNSVEIDEIEMLIQRQIERCDQYDEVVRLPGKLSGPVPFISGEFKSEVYETKLKKLFDWVSSGNPLVQPGCINTFILHKASSEGLPIGLYSLLAAGAPLWSPICNKSLIQLSFNDPANPTLATFIFAKALEDRLVTEMNRLVAEMRFNPQDVLDNKLKRGIEDVVEQLQGKTPWLAQYPNECGSDEMTKLLVRACSHGATHAAWWLRHAGANTNSKDLSTGKTALQSALKNHHYDTATDLIRYMGANPFVPDSSSKLPIELFPEEQREDIYLGCLAEESSRLKRLCEQVRNRHTIPNDVMRLILLLGVLYITFQRRATIARNNMEEFYVSSLQKFMETMEMMEGLARDDCKSKAFWSLVSTLLQKIYKPRRKSLESNSFFRQLHLKVLGVSRALFENQDQNLSFDSVLMDAFKMCSKKRFPFFLHLIVSLGRVNVKTHVNEECRTTALHHAAAKGNMSAVSYLISMGAGLFSKDRYGRSPLQYASFYGHNITRKYLESQYDDDQGIHEKCSLGRSAADYSKAYCTYLETCGVEVNSSAPKYNSEYFQINYHLQKIEKLWKAKGIIDATGAVTVDYEKGEAACIRNAVEESVKKLLSAVASRDSTFEGQLKLLGSSAEGVRLFLPDEFDFNWILTNNFGLQEDGLKVKLENSTFRATGVDQTFTIHSDNIDEEYMKWNYGGILREFMKVCQKSLVNFEFSDKRLSLVPPGVKYKMVGLGLTLMWSGKEYPQLFIDVDIVPTIRAPWPDDLKRAPLLPKNVNVIYLSTSVDGGWRLSNGTVERIIFDNLHGLRKVVFLACKMLLSALKVPDWVPTEIKNQYRYFADGYQRIRCPNGFVLKSSFFRELEEMKDDSHWLEDKVFERVISIFRRMCEKEKANPPSGENRHESRDVFSYFSGSTADPISANGAPEILRFLSHTNIP